MGSSQATADKKLTFTHLEVHSHYTMLGATSPVEALVARASAESFSFLALTDTNALYGAVLFQNACLAVDICPIIGMTVSVAPPPGAGARHYDLPGQLVLLAKGSAGYRSLCRISSIIQGSSQRELLARRGIDWESLSSNSESLICLSGGRRGWVERLLRHSGIEAARDYLIRLASVFGEDTYLALEIHAREDADIAQELEGLGRRHGLKSIPVQPVYCLEPEEADRLELLRAIDENQPLEGIQRKYSSSRLAWQDSYWLTQEEVAARFNPLHGLMEGLAEITQQCQPALPGGGPIWPSLNLPDGKTSDEALAELARQGLRSKYEMAEEDGVAERLEKELAAIKRTGYTPLFLIVADIVRFAREADIPVSTRGSVANSLVAYCANITTVDPIEHDLLFERFLNPARSTPPDIDLDFCSRRRDEVLAYVRETYGEDRVALVATISTMRPKSAVRETGKALGLDETEIDHLARSLPRDWHPDPRRRSRRTVEDLLEEMDDVRLKKVLVSAYELVGQPHHLSIHPGGVVITPGPLTDYIPLQWAPKGFFITQFDHKDLEILGLPKLDLLGIRALTVMADAADLVRQHYDPHFRLAEIPLDDGPTGDLLESGQTIGVFQCESTGAQRTLRQLKARTITDLAVANAFFKPGPATGGMAQAFIRRYRGEEKVTYLHPALEPILSPTKGVLLFQEQVLRVATEIADLTWEQANQLRLGMTRFRPEEMQALQAQFLAGCTRGAPGGPGFTGRQAQTLWEQVMAFAGYGFNRGHATAYADVSYRSAYLKAHWPAPFFCARLADWGGFHNPAIYAAEANRLGIAVRPPHVNYSLAKFTLTLEEKPANPDAVGKSPTEVIREAAAVDRQPVLWMGLGQVRDLRRKAIKEIVETREARRYSSLEDLLERVSLQVKEVTHLIQCGALDGLGSNRANMLAKAEAVRRAGSTRQMAFSFSQDPVKETESPAERLEWERTILGRPVSVHPLDLVETWPHDLVPLRELARSEGRTVRIAGIRLPGWTGGPGFFLGDRDTFVVARGDERLEMPEAWRPVLIRGRWAGDEWGNSWLQVESLSAIDSR